MVILVRIQNRLVAISTEKCTAARSHYLLTHSVHVCCELVAWLIFPGMIFVWKCLNSLAIANSVELFIKLQMSGSALLSNRYRAIERTEIYHGTFVHLYNMSNGLHVWDCVCVCVCGRRWTFECLCVRFWVLVPFNCISSFCGTRNVDCMWWEKWVERNYIEFNCTWSMYTLFCIGIDFETIQTLIA